VIGSDKSEFFSLTKQIHNLIHGQGDPYLGPEAREVYEAVNGENAIELGRLLSKQDIVAVHDPQPFALGAMLKKSHGVCTIWRCHIGLDEDLPATRAAWRFLEPWAGSYNHAIFTAPEYIPSYFAGRASIIQPAIDPLSHKNRELSPHKLVGVLCNSSLAVAHHPVLTPPFPNVAMRLSPDGSFVPAALKGDIGLLYRPIVTQVSRWDKLKGFMPLLEGFCKLKRQAWEHKAGHGARERQRLQIMRLCLAGPAPGLIQDDPESQEVLSALSEAYLRLSPALQEDIALLTMPMQDRKQGSLATNALQRCSTVVVQNSLREGFGLTATEAMWKGASVLGTNAVGLRHQIRDNLDGRLVHHPEDPDEIAETLRHMLAHPKDREMWGKSARRRVYDEFLVFSQVARWLRVLSQRMCQ